MALNPFEQQQFGTAGVEGVIKALAVKGPGFPTTLVMCQLNWVNPLWPRAQIKGKSSNAMDLADYMRNFLLFLMPSLEAL